MTTLPCMRDIQHSTCSSGRDAVICLWCLECRTRIMGTRVVSVRRDPDWLVQFWKKVIDGELLAMRNLFSFPFLFSSFSLLDTTQGTSSGCLHAGDGSSLHVSKTRADYILLPLRATAADCRPLPICAQTGSPQAGCDVFLHTHSCGEVFIVVVH